MRAVRCVRLTLGEARAALGVLVGLLVVLTLRALLGGPRAGAAAAASSPAFAGEPAPAGAALAGHDGHPALAVRPGLPPGWEGAASTTLEAVGDMLELEGPATVPGSRALALDVAVSSGGLRAKSLRVDVACGSRPGAGSERLGGLSPAFLGSAPLRASVAVALDGCVEGVTAVVLSAPACDSWGRLVGDVECDEATAPAPAKVEVLAVEALRDAPPDPPCDPSVLRDGHGASCSHTPSCPLDALYTGLVMPPSGKQGELLAALDSHGHDGARVLPGGVLEGIAQGFRCEDVAASTLVGCKAARGVSTHKAVYFGTYRNATTGISTRVVVKEGGVRYPPPFRGERGVGFDQNETATEQTYVLESMWYEGVQEIALLELLQGHPAVPRQIGACISRDGLLATSVVAAASVPLKTAADLVAIASGEPVRALALAVSAAELFAFLVETRFLRLEDLHWGEQFVTSDAAQYAADDISQFAVGDSEKLDLQIIDLDKVIVSHDLEVFWYIQEYSMPFVAQRLFAPLADLLPGLDFVIQQMNHSKVHFRPRSFKCISTWLQRHDALEMLSGDPAERPLPLPACLCRNPSRGVMPCELHLEYEAGA